jgi:putative heme-binding domain-containing protein
VLSSAEQERLRNLDEFLRALQTVGTDWGELADAEPPGDLADYALQVEELLLQAMQLADDERRTDDDRIAAATLMCRVAQHRETGLGLLSQWLRPQVDPALQTRVIDVMLQSGSPLVPGTLAKAWPELSPALRGIALNVWLSREAWTIDLLDRIERHEISARSLDLTQIARLQRHPKNSLATRAQAVIGKASTSSRSQVVESFRKSLELPGHAAIGRLVYQRACATCHRRGDEGTEMGPNLATVVEHSREKLLTNILDPNADIQPGYHAYTCLLESGEILAGLLAGETANSVTIRQINGVSRSVARREIERLQNSNQSFMPEGLEAALSPQDMADLLAFLQQPVVKDAAE